MAGEPSWAALIVMAMLLAGAAAGTVWRDRVAQRERTDGFNAYVLAVNPIADAASMPP